MIIIQKLIEPKKSSGKKLDAGKSMSLRGVEIKNSNKFSIYVDTYNRKKRTKKKVEKAP